MDLPGSVSVAESLQYWIILRRHLASFEDLAPCWAEIVLVSSRMEMTWAKAESIVCVGGTSGKVLQKV